MKTIIALGVTGLLAYAGELLFPWWIAVTAAFITGYIFGRKGWQAFLIGFGGIFLLWLIYALLLNMQSGGLMAGKIGLLFGLGKPWLMAVVSALIGGLAAGTGSLAGFQFRSLMLFRTRSPHKYKV